MTERFLLFLLLYFNYIIVSAWLLRLMRFFASWFVPIVVVSNVVFGLFIMILAD